MPTTHSCSYLWHPPRGHQDGSRSAGIAAGEESSGSSPASPGSTGRCSTKSSRLLALPVDHDLKIMRERQSLGHITSAVLSGIDPLLEATKPDLVMVHGDTTTTFAAALAAFYRMIPVAHVEAGLRTDNIYNPYPEEMNRRLADRLAEIYYAPTNSARAALLREGSAPSRHPGHRQHRDRRPSGHRRHRCPRLGARS